MDLEDLLGEAFRRANFGFKTHKGEFRSLLIKTGLNLLTDRFRAEGVRKRPVSKKKRLPRVGGKLCSVTIDTEGEITAPTKAALGPLAQAMLGEIVHHIKLTLRQIPSVDRRRVLV